MKSTFFSDNFCFLLICCIFVSFWGCSSPQDDAAEHIENARRYFAAQEYEKAKIAYLNVIQLAPGNDAARFELGETYVHLQDPVKAAASFHEAVTHNPENL